MASSTELSRDSSFYLRENACFLVLDCSKVCFLGIRDCIDG